MAGPQPERRLKSWKEIAGYIHRDTRTAKRYEVERGLPVHRMPGGGKSVVFAYAHEIDAWLRGGETAEAPTHEGVSAEDAEEPTTPRRSGQVLPAFIAFLALAIGCGAVWAGSSWRRGPPAAATTASANPRAQALYLSGRFAWNRRTASSLRRAAEDFAQAASIDPQFARAYVGLADTYNLMPEFGGLAPDDAYPRARAAAEKAVALAPRSAEAHRALAFALFYWFRDQRRSDREFRTSLALEPQSAQTHHWYANALAARGAFEAALNENEQAELLDPTNTAIKADRGWVLFVSGRYPEALRRLQEVEMVQPDYARAYIYMADVYDALGRPAEMLDQWDHAADLIKDARLRALTDAGRRALPGGPRAVLQSITDEAERRYAAGQGSPFELAGDEMRLGRTDRALTYLEACIQRHDPAAIVIPTARLFAPLRPLQRFQRIIRAARTAA